MDRENSILRFLRIVYVIFAFCAALLLGALKGLLVGPIAGLLLILGSVGVILGLFPAHVIWTVYTVLKTNRFDAPLKVGILLGLPALFAIWLGLSIAGSVILGVGYGFFTPWVSAFEAFRQGDEFKKFVHCIVDGTWGTIKGSCTMVRDFADLCYHSYPLYLEELRESPVSDQLKPLRLIHVPGVIIVGLMGLIIDVPLFTLIALVKSPFMLFKGWFRLTHDLVSREGPFLETACIPIAGLTIILWPIAVVGSVVAAIFSSVFIALYGSIVVYQERSFSRGAAYVVAAVAEFDEYTNDWLYLREGTVFPKPRYRKRGASRSSEISVGGTSSRYLSASAEAPAMLVPSLAPSRSVREAIQEVKMVQIWGHVMKSCEIRGKQLLACSVITTADLSEWLKARNDQDATVVGVGLPTYSLLHTLLNSIKVGSSGILLHETVEITYHNRPTDKLLEWFFHPLMVLKEQIRVIKLTDAEVRYLERVLLFGGNRKRMEAWEGDNSEPMDALRVAQIEGISRRMIGMSRSCAMLPTYRRRYRQVVKALIAHAGDNEVSMKSVVGKDATTSRSSSMKSLTGIEEV